MRSVTVSIRARGYSDLVDRIANALSTVLDSTGIATSSRCSIRASYQRTQFGTWDDASVNTGSANVSVKFDGNEAEGDSVAEMVAVALKAREIRGASVRVTSKSTQADEGDDLTEDDLHEDDFAGDDTDGPSGLKKLLTFGK